MQCSAYLFHYYSTAIIEHLARNGVMPLEVLYEPPFTDFHFEGLDGAHWQKGGTLSRPLLGL
jgi:hypothetical protein